MNCEQVAPYLPGLAGGELGAETIGWVEAHITGCESCRAEASRYRSLATGLATLTAREIEPPAYLAEAIAERVRTDRRHRFLPLPLVSPELVRAVTDNRDAIVSAGAVLVAAGAALALWRAARANRAPRIAGA